MFFFHTGGHGLFLLALTVIGPAIAAALIGSLGAAGALRHRGETEAQTGGLALESAPHPAPKQGPLAPSDEQPAVTSTMSARHASLSDHTMSDQTMSGQTMVDQTPAEQTLVAEPVSARTRVDNRGTHA